jgi:lipopolysaccharide export system permease protein
MAVMRSITRYIFNQLWLTTVFVTLGLTFAVWLTQSLRFFGYIVNRGLPATTFFAFVGLLLPSFLGIVLPIATFCAVLFVYNKLALDSEMVVLRAAGLSHAQLARPAIMLGLATMLVVYAISLYFQPLSYRAFKDLQYRIRNDYSTVLLREGVFNELGDGITVYVRERTADGELRGILVHDSRRADNPVTMMAERGALVRAETGPRVVMVNGNRQEVDRDHGQLSLLYFDRYTVEVATFAERPEFRWREPKERFLADLLSPGTAGDDLRARGELIAEGHQRLVAPLYTLTFVLIGLAALLSGQFNRRGQVYRVVAAVLCTAVLEGLGLALHDLAGRSLRAIPLMYLAAVLPACVSIFLLLRRQRRRPATEPPLAAISQ